MSPTAEEMFRDPNYESVSCQLNCGFVLFFHRNSEESKAAWKRMVQHKAMGCDLDKNRPNERGYF